MLGRSVAQNVGCRFAGVVCLALAAVACGSEEDPGIGMVPAMGQAGSMALPMAGTSAAGSPASGAAGGLPVGIAGSGAAGSTPTGAAGRAAGAAGSGAGMSGAAGMTGDAGVSGAAGMAAAAGTGGGPAAGTGGADGEAGGGAAGGPAMTHMDLGEGDGNDVITIGDSWMNLILTGIEQSLERASGRNYRNYAAPGTLVLNEQIPGQYETAKRADPDIKTIVMTGGGNDILTSPCTGDACQSIVDDVSERLNELMMEAAMDGVEDIVIIGYTYPADMGKHASLDYSIKISNMICTKMTKPRCHFLDSTMLDIMLQDGIHPNAAGYDLIGKTVWELMQAEGMRR